jgi:hypothetical protein
MYKIELTKSGQVVEIQEVNTADPAVAEGAAIRRRAELGNKVDGWRIVNELRRTIKKSEN